MGLVKDHQDPPIRGRGLACPLAGLGRKGDAGGKEPSEQGGEEQGVAGKGGHGDLLGFFPG